MIAKQPLGAFVLAALAVVALGASASAQCTTCAVPTTTAYTAYSPVVYQTYRPYTGWYPGYWLDRASVSVWGRPVTYSAYYAPTYSTSYRPAYTVRYASTAYYAPACSTCSSYTSCDSPCTTCGVQQVSLRPICDACTTCGSCGPCGCGTVTQAGYVIDSGCAGCAVAQPAAAVAVPQQGGVAVPLQAVPQGAAPSGAEPAPALAPGETPPTFRQTEKPAADADAVDLPPEPAPEESEDSASNFDAPQLLNPNDRTAQRHVAPVRNAVYRTSLDDARPVAHATSWQQAQRDAQGWTSASE